MQIQTIHKSFRLCATTFALTIAAISAASAQEIITIDVPGATSTSAWGVNAYRDVVGVYVTPDKNNHGFLWRLGKITTIDFPGAPGSHAWGINSRGDIAGDYTINGVTHGYLLSDGKFTTIDYPGAAATSLASINDRGEIASAYNLADGSSHGFLLVDGKFRNIDFPGATSTQGNGLNNQGDIVQNYTLAGVTHGLLLRNGAFTTIDFPQATFTGAYGINPAGNVVGRYRDAGGVTHGFLQAGAVFTAIDVPGASLTAVSAINGYGGVAGRYVSGGVTHAFLMTKPTLLYNVTDLGVLPGGSFSQATNIDNNGIITGLAATHEGTQHAVVWQGGKLFDLSNPGLGGKNSGVFGMNKWGQALVQAESSVRDPNNENFCAYGTGLKCLPALWQGGMMTPLPLLGGNNGTVGTINARGQAVGISENGIRDWDCPSVAGVNGAGPQYYGFEAVVWGPGPGELKELRPLKGDTVGMALAINDRGQAVGASGSCANTLLPPLALAPHAVLWEPNGNPRDLGTLGGTVDAAAGIGNVALSINNKGQTVGASVLPGNKTVHAFLWNSGTGMRDLGALRGDDKSVAFGINGTGEMVGISFNSEGNPRGFLWRNGGMTDFNELIRSPSFYVLSANAINDRGEVVGFGVSATGDIHAFLATPKTVTGPALEIPYTPRPLIRQSLPLGRFSPPAGK
jgi:probable HAF family extracellular repeat protein